MTAEEPPVRGWPEWDVKGDDAIVDLALLRRTLDFVFDRAMQNHKLHELWNEGANGDFVTCTRGDCTEAKSVLRDWGRDLR